jgi:hypothetical protein
MSENPEPPASAPGFFGLPRTRFGWSSVGFAAAFFVFFWVFWLQRNSPRDGATIGPDPVHVLLLLGAAASALAGGVMAVVANIWRHERSFLLLPALLLSLFVLTFTIGALLGG